MGPLSYCNPIQMSDCFKDSLMSTPTLCLLLCPGCLVRLEDCHSQFPASCATVILLPGRSSKVGREFPGHGCRQSSVQWTVVTSSQHILPCLSPAHPLQWLPLPRPHSGDSNLTCTPSLTAPASLNTESRDHTSFLQFPRSCAFHFCTFAHLSQPPGMPFSPSPPEEAWLDPD